MFVMERLRPSVAAACRDLAALNSKESRIPGPEDTLRPRAEANGSERHGLAVLARVRAGEDALPLSPPPSGLAAAVEAARRVYLVAH